MDKKFPRLLTKAIIKKNTLYFRYGDLCQSDEDYDEYFDWRAWHGFTVCRPNDLLKLYARGAYQREIRALLIQNDKLSLLGRAAAKPRKRRTKLP